MATPRKTVDTTPVYDDQPGEMSLSNLPFAPVEQEPEEIALANVLADLGGVSDAKVNIHRILPGKGQEFVASYSPELFSVENLQAEFGGGEYQIYVRAEGQIRTRRVIRVAEPKKTVTPTVDNSAQFQSLAEMIAESNRRNAELMTQTLQAIAANQPKPKSTLELLQEMKMMRELMGVGAATQADPMDAMLKHFELFKTLAPRDHEPSGMEVMLEGLKSIAPVLAQGAARQNAAPALYPPVPKPGPFSQPVLTNPTEPAPITPEPSQPIQGNEDMNLAQQFIINMLVSNAAADNDPSPYANMLIDTMGAEQARQAAETPDWFEQLCKARPDAAPYKEWFDELRQTIIDLTNPELSGTNDSNNLSDAPAHAIQQSPVEPAPAEPAGPDSQA